MDSAAFWAPAATVEDDTETASATAASNAKHIASQTTRRTPTVFATARLPTRPPNEGDSTHKQTIAAKDYVAGKKSEKFCRRLSIS